MQKKAGGGGQKKIFLKSQRVHNPINPERIV